ncbi:F-box protein CPR1-like [Papaver somniferum]|uniref:F-box protein CPR1-like n=1 Tax=Papaver somniferum TaxID=3469 RepID=UPI000E7038A3|nr:F-box protein CPR1-like [Papaver somniferum]XP_026419584.1 F-box protein CPR1-like [Papaver somniferum]XP_026419589.1 F-box protein CPR1-like [Papaver somniferum]XP_026419593.1 F-box protein CPR1-like [Papaver somniferum]XP_026419597.1 F-box protein CPR1-like [Papaver somniferum]XP_026419599.1 F-box protein CPR1-like [Papaver somniferum]
MLEGSSSGGLYPEVLYSIGYDSLTSSVCEIKDASIEMDHPFKSLRYLVRLMGSCNGLVCIRLVVDNDNGDEKNYFYLWNPATREYKEIPKSPIKIDRIQMSALGYDHNTDDYKLVIGTVEPPGSKGTLVQVYSLASNSWKPGQTVAYWFPSHYLEKHKHGVLVNGYFHWLVIAEHKFSLLSLGISDESFKELHLLPKELLEKNKQRCMSLGVLEGCLCLCLLVTSDVDVPMFEVWQMLDYGVQESWARRFIIPLNSIMENCLIFLSPLWSFENGEILLMSSSNLVLYDPEHGSARKLSKPSNSTCLTVNYIDSLVSLESGTYVGGEGRMEELRET